MIMAVIFGAVRQCHAAAPEEPKPQTSAPAEKPLVPPVCTENLIPVGARQNHLPSVRDDRPDVFLP
jgi:hypothetical protein